METGDRSLHEVTGKLVLAQEDRLRVQTDDGRSMLLIVGKNAGKSLDQLDSLAQGGRTVRVKYRGDLNAGAVAYEVKEV